METEQISTTPSATPSAMPLKALSLSSDTDGTEFSPEEAARVIKQLKTENKRLNREINRLQRKV
ncbi:MAG: hypothetical protein LBH50_04105, partial [Spirochaetaceae bacterium]|nr:hypothetical protein [Spirochaetaceae bacterium]